MFYIMSHDNEKFFKIIQFVKLFFNFYIKKKSGYATGYSYTF